MSAMNNQGRGKGNCRGTGRRQQADSCRSQEGQNSGGRRGLGQCNRGLKPGELRNRSNSLKRETEE